MRGWLRERPWVHPRPRLRTILLAVNLLILLLPLAGIAVLRLYEDELIRGTEAQLLAMGAMVRETYRGAFLEEAARQRRSLEELPPVRVPPSRALEAEALLPRLEVHRSAVRPPAPAARAPQVDPDPIAVAAGVRVSPALRAASRASLVGVRLVDARGVVVGSSSEELGLSLAAREEVRAALRGRPTSLLRVRISDEPPPAYASISRGQRYRVFVALPVVEQGRLLGAVVLSRTPLDIAKALYVNRRVLAWGGAALLLVVALASALTAVTISWPLRKLVGQAGRAERGERGAVAPIPHPVSHEVAQLSMALASMARALEDRAEYIRTFASHVSHEFKTPLTTIRGTVELLRDHGTEMTPDERDRFLANLDDTSARLERLVRRLLELARADVLRPAGGRADVASALTRAAESARALGLDVAIDHRAGRAAARISPDVLDDVLRHLVDNVRQHGGTSVALSSTGEDAIELRVADDGPGISAANAIRVFEPFFTTARERGGSGLGLSIVRRLLEAHGGTIELVPRERGVELRIVLPAAEPVRPSVPPPSTSGTRPPHPAA